MQTYREIPKNIVYGATYIAVVSYDHHDNLGYTIYKWKPNIGVYARFGAEFEEKSNAVQYVTMMNHLESKT